MLVTPSALVALLTYMWNSPQHDLWLETLPVSGEGSDCVQIGSSAEGTAA